MILKINKDKLKQIFLSCLAIVLIGLGYFNYNSGITNKDVIEVSADYNEVNLGDVELVNSDIVPNDNLEEDNIVLNETISKAVTNDELENDYFVETRIEREKMYSEMIEVYQKLIKSEETPLEQKTIAAQEVTNITNTKNSIMIAENLIKNKGFEDVVVLVNSENVNVVVKSSKLNQEEISKIQNIVQRELKVDFSNIAITNK